MIDVKKKGESWMLVVSLSLRIGSRVIEFGRVSKKKRRGTWIG